MRCWGDFLNELEGLKESTHRSHQPRKRYARGGSVKNRRRLMLGGPPAPPVPGGAPALTPQEIAAQRIAKLKNPFNDVVEKAQQQNHYRQQERLPAKKRGRTEQTKQQAMDSSDELLARRRKKQKIPATANDLVFFGSAPNQNAFSSHYLRPDVQASLLPKGSASTYSLQPEDELYHSRYVPDPASPFNPNMGRVDTYRGRIKNISPGFEIPGNRIRLSHKGGDADLYNVHPLQHMNASYAPDPNDLIYTHDLSTGNKGFTKNLSGYNSPPEEDEGKED